VSWWRSHAWRVYLAAGTLLTLLYWAVPPLKGSGPVINGLGLSGVVAVIVGLRRNRPASRLPWWLFALGLGLFWAGDVYTYSYPKLLHKDVPFPSIGDGVYLTVYPALMAGLLLLVRRRNPQSDHSGLIDSLIMTLGLALVEWVGLIAPNLHADGMSAFARMVSVAYPLGDTLLLAAAIRLIVDAGKRQPAFYLLVTSIVSLLVTDYVYGLLLLHGTYTHQLWLDIGWISFYLLWGAAALHPSMGTLEQADPGRQRRLTGFRLALLTCASLVAPTILLIHQIRHEGLDLLVVIETSIVLFGLVVARMAGLNRRQERSYARERALSSAGARLVAATSREEIHAAALEGALSLGDSVAAIRLCMREDGGLNVVAASNAEACWRLSGARAAILMHASAGEQGGLVELDNVSRQHLRVGAAFRWALVHQLAWDGCAHGLIATCLRHRPSQGVRGALQSLATHVSLALESAALTEEVLRRTSDARLSSLVQHASDLITVLDADANVVYQSPSIEGALGYRPDEVVGRPFERLLAAGDRHWLLHLLADDAESTRREGEVIECSLRHSDGSVREFEILRTNLLHDETVGGIVLNGRDVSERKAFEQQLAHQAFHDPVTGLANRALFAERVRHALARTRRDGEGIAVIFLDLDDFKTINDSLGHAAGDQVLVDVARRLDGCVRASDTAARFGGDEFAVLLEDVAGLQEAADAAERIVEAFTDPLLLEQKQLVVRASLGIAMAHDATIDADELIRNADAAMYIAKRDGKGGYRLFEPAMHEVVLQRLELRADLQRAIVGNELELHYQPVVRLADGSVCGLEALVRCRTPERGLVAPGEFIPFAEETGLIIPIGRWVLREGCRKAKALQDAFPVEPPLTMSINLSVKQLQHSDIVADVSDALADAGLDARHLTLEITETVVMADLDLAIARLEQLKDLGVRLAMDDFGTGYSSLSYLSRFPIDVLKMDRSFLSAGATPEASGLASAVVAIGQTLELDVVAEGIELVEQWNTLRDLGCDHGQGFYFARPMDEDAAFLFMAQAVAGSGAERSGATASRGNASQL
jgi:diguanylate cyclase (GGDEF)-like protein/PAS domain S-box-containing protein